MTCAWDISYERCTGSNDAKFLATISEDMREKAESMATDLLSAWTGGVFGPCPVTVRPCRDEIRTNRDFQLSRRANWEPVLIGGRWFNMGCSSCGRSCACDAPYSLAVPGPVADVIEVEIDGDTLPPENYRVEGRFIIRQDGGSWPTYQDRSLPDGSEGTWSITYNKGIAVPVGGQIAAGVLALEIMRALCDDSECKLPERVQTITRQGVTMAMMDTFEGLDEGRTGLWLVDSWVSSVTRPRRGGTVSSPDFNHTRSTV